MALKVCRLCLCRHDLGPIFANANRQDRFSLVLGLTTGLKIEPNDGLPQLICRDCTYLVNTALDLRNRSHMSEMKLIARGCKRKSKNTCETTEPINEESKENNNTEENNDDACDFDGCNEEPDVELAKDGGEEEPRVETSAQPTVSAIRAKRDVYLAYVEGEFKGNGPIQCKICKKTVSRWACFINHAKKHIGFTHICEYCGMRFISITQLMRHCRAKHGVPRDIQCKYCNYLALDNAQLAIHVRRLHTSERPFQCDICGAAYFSRKCLVQHIEYHRTEDTVQCDQCPSKFKSQRHLAKHKYSAHKKHRTRSSVLAVRKEQEQFL